MKDMDADTKDRIWHLLELDEDHSFELWMLNQYDEINEFKQDIHMFLQAGITFPLNTFKFFYARNKQRYEGHL